MSSILTAPPPVAQRLSRGWAAALAGDIAAAERDFTAIGRLVGPRAAAIAWPSLDGAAWPFPTPRLNAAFEALKPPGAGWPRITLVTPSFNQAPFLPACLGSVVAQGYPNLQHIVMDGGSTDGSADILRAHAPHLAALEIAQDRGQTHALNKGFALADGNLVGWLNSDDMLAPGALHAVALGWLKTGADLIYGHLLAHRDHVFEAANEPRAAGAFTPEALGDIFGRWFQGHYFYQPEVFFTRSLLQRAGGQLDETLGFAMDYELWMRFAALGADVAPVNWPVALFRHHDAQKTANLDASIVEQAGIRDRFVDFAPSPARRRALADRLAAFWAAPSPRLHLVTPSGDDAVAQALGAAARLVSRGDGVSMVPITDFGPQFGEPAANPLFVVILRSPGEASVLDTLRAAHPQALIAVWFWTGHTDTGSAYLAAQKADLVVPGEADAAYLRNRHALQLSPIPPEARHLDRVVAALRRAALDARLPPAH